MSSQDGRRGSARRNEGAESQGYGGALTSSRETRRRGVSGAYGSVMSFLIAAGTGGVSPSTTIGVLVIVGLLVVAWSYHRERKRGRLLQDPPLRIGKEVRCAPGITDGNVRAGDALQLQHASLAGVSPIELREGGGTVAFTMWAQYEKPHDTQPTLRQYLHADPDTSGKVEDTMDTAYSGGHLAFYEVGAGYHPKAGVMIPPDPLAQTREQYLDSKSA